MAALLRHLSQDLVDGKLAQQFFFFPFFLSFFFLLFSSTKKKNIPSSSFSSSFLWLSFQKRRTAALCFISQKKEKAPGFVTRSDCLLFLSISVSAAPSLCAPLSRLRGVPLEDECQLSGLQPRPGVLFLPSAVLTLGLLSSSCLLSPSLCVHLINRKLL